MSRVNTQYMSNDDYDQIMGPSAPAAQQQNGSSLGQIAGIVNYAANMGGGNKGDAKATEVKTSTEPNAAGQDGGGMGAPVAEKQENNGSILGKVLGIVALL